MKYAPTAPHAPRAAVGGLLLLTLVLAACNKHEVEAKPVRPVQTQRVTIGVADDRAIYPGEVRARYETDLAFRVSGKVVARYVDVGAMVKKGQPLAKLDPSDAQLNAEAAKAQMLAAETDFKFAQAELARYQPLLNRHVISKAAYDQKLNAFNVAKAKLEQQRMQYSWSRNQSAYTTLTADADGVITAVNMEVGQVVNVGQTVMKLARPEQKEVVINVPESRLSDLQQAKEIAVNIWAMENKLYLGRVREISPAGDPATRTYTVKITIADADSQVKLGMTANAIVRKSEAANVAVLPLTALTQRDGAPAVWVVDPKSNQVNLRPVQIGQYRADGVTVLSGLQPNELVVTAGVHKLVPGQQVRLYAPVETNSSQLADRS